MGDVVRGSVRLYRASFLPLLLCYAIANIPATVLLFYALYENSVVLKLIALAGVAVCTLFGYTGVTLCISDACTGNKPSFLRSFARGRLALGKLMLASLLLVPSVSLGYVLLLIPGVILSLWFLYVPLVVVLERRSAWSAFKRSRQLSKGFNLRNLGVLVVGGLMLMAAYIVTIIAVFVLSVLLGQLGWKNGAQVAYIAMLIGYAGGMLFCYAIFPIFFIMIVLTYYDLRARKEGYDSMALAAELGR
jgi:hypothetical protein